MVLSALKRAYHDAKEPSQTPNNNSRGYFNCSSTPDGGLKFEKFTRSKYTPAFLKLIGCWTRDPDEYNYVNAQAFGVPDVPELSELPTEYNSVVDRMPDGRLMFNEERWQREYDEICELASQLDDGSGSPLSPNSPASLRWGGSDSNKSQDRLSVRSSIGNELEGLWPAMRNPFSLLDNLHEVEGYSQYNSNRRLFKQKERAAEREARRQRLADVTIDTPALMEMPAEAQHHLVRDPTAHPAHPDTQVEQPDSFEVDGNERGDDPTALEVSTPPDSNPVLRNCPSMITILDEVEPSEFRAPIQSVLDEEADACKIADFKSSSLSSKLSFVVGDDSKLKAEPEPSPERRLSSQSTGSKRISLPRWQDLPSSPSQVGRTVSLKENLLHRRKLGVEAKEQSLARAVSAPTRRPPPSPKSPLVARQVLSPVPESASLVPHALRKTSRRLPRAPKKEPAKIETVPVMILSDVNQEEAAEAIVPSIRIPEDQWIETIGSWPSRLGDMIVESWYAGASVGDIAAQIKSNEWDFVDVETGEEIDVEVTVMRFLMTVGLWGSIRRKKSQRATAQARLRRDSVEESRVDRLSALVYKQLATSERFAEEYLDEDS